MQCIRAAVVLRRCQLFDISSEEKWNWLAAVGVPASASAICTHFGFLVNKANARANISFRYRANVLAVAHIFHLNCKLCDKFTFDRIERALNTNEIAFVFAHIYTSIFADIGKATVTVVPHWSRDSPSVFFFVRSRTTCLRLTDDTVTHRQI